jgi:hypothetical protein
MNKRPTSKLVYSGAELQLEFYQSSEGSVPAEEWLDEKCTDKRKEKIEEEIHKINKYVADMLGIEYNMNG